MRRLKLRRQISVLIAVMAFVAVALFAQIPKVEDKWWKDEKVRTELRLTFLQQQQLDKLMEEFRGRLLSISSELKAKRQERENLAKESGKNTDAYRKLTNQIYLLKGELEKAQMTLRIRAGEVLTPRQKLALRRIQSAKK